MAVERALVGYRFWLWWVLLTFVGWTIGGIMGFFLGHVLLGNVMAGIGIGGGVGFMQWLALRRHVRQAGWWALASAAGLTVCFGLFEVVYLIWGYPFDLVGWVVVLVVGGALSGVLQQRILRRHVRRSGWWVLASTVGWGLSVVGPALPQMDSGPIVVMIIRNLVAPLALAGGVLGTVTGGALIWLLRQPMPRKVS